MTDSPTTKPGRSVQAAGLAGWLLVTFAAAALGNWATMSSVGDWYQTLERPHLTPPDWVFGPVWTLLYLMMAVAAWLVWRQGGWSGARVPLLLFIVQLALNTVWSVLFFGLQSPKLALGEIVVLWLMIAATTWAFWKRSCTAGWLLVPYLAWVAFAAVLNLEFARLNP